jgi:hypothetical protein
MSRGRLVLSAILTAVITFGVFIIVRFIQVSEVTTTDLVASGVVALVTGLTTVLLFRR